MKAIYWKPSVEWEIESVEILHEVQRETKNVLLQADAYRASQRGTNCYLKDVAYRVKAHLIPSDYTVQFAQDQQFGLVKHIKIAHSRFSKGCGYAVPVLGVSECRAFVREACEEDGPGFYSDKGIFADMMLLDIVYPTPQDDSLYRIYWQPEIEDGKVMFPNVKSVVSAFKQGTLSPRFVVEEITKGNYRLPRPDWQDAEGPVMKNV